MKLHASARYSGAGSYHIGSGFVDEEQNRCHERRQAPCQFGGSLQAYGTWAGRIQHKAYGIGARSHGRVHILLACEAADLDAGTCGRVHGNQSKAAVVLGRPHFSS